MFCNWLTEMRDRNMDNVVYTWVDNGDGDGTASNGIWEDDETDEDNAKNGYRLPTSDEWEYTARYLGTTAPSTGDDLDTERLYGNDDVSWTDSYYWTPGDYASGATADYNDGHACQAVAVYDYTNPDPYNDEQEVKSLGSGSENTLGLYDMSGNVWEWCFTSGGSSRINRGGSWGDDAENLRVGYWNYLSPDNAHNYLGFRVCRTAD
jgi:formylglycine-generating enzyme required for sulfatase activity